ncbi:MAG: hypothetical protein ACREDC_05715 [Bradyrhizobium sp.]
MSYEVKTPLLLESVAAARAAISGIRDSSLEPPHANSILSGARTLQSAVAHDLKVRLLAPKIEALERRAAA